MKDTDLFQLALALTPPWRVVACRFDSVAKRLDIELDFPKGSRFACPDCPAYDTEEMTWRRTRCRRDHLNFFQHEAYLHARVPRISCNSCGVRRVTVPWARKGSGFTLLFEAYAMMLMSTMPVNAVAKLVDEHDTTLWRVLHHYIDDARSGADYSNVTHASIAEIAAKRGHNHVTLFVDHKESKVLFVTYARNLATVGGFTADIAAHGGSNVNITEVCIDMRVAFIKGVADHLPKASITFDKFYAVKLINDAVDQVRREEQKSRPELKKTRYAWLKSKINLSAAQHQSVADLSKRNLKTARAYNIRLAFQDLYLETLCEAAEAYLKKWYFWATHSRLTPLVEAAKTISSIGMACCVGLTARSPTALSRASTVTFRPPRSKPEATDPPTTLRRSFISLREAGTPTTRVRQRRA